MWIWLTLPMSHFVIPRSIQQQECIGLFCCGSCIMGLWYPCLVLFESYGLFRHPSEVSQTEARKKGVVCFVAFNCTTKRR